MERIGKLKLSATPRLQQLDALRGIAALFVVFNHYAQSVPEKERLVGHIGKLTSWDIWLSPWTWLRFTPFRLVVSGGAAVDVFFVLSGFVLALTLTRGRQPSYWAFLIKRVCRVYIPFAIVMLCVATAYSVVPAVPSASSSNWLNNIIPHPSYSLVAELLMTGGDISLNPVMWTLIHEMRMSFVLPLIFLLIRKFGAVQTVAVCLFISIAASADLGDATSGSWQATLHFLWMFAAGSAIAYHRDYITVLVVGARRSAKWSLWLVALMLLIATFDRVWSNFALGGGAVILICLCLPTSSASRALVSPVPLWLGRISYSLYLIHLPILVLSIASGLAVSASVYAFALTLVLADVVNRMVETPAHQIGVSLSRAINGIGNREVVGIADSVSLTG